MRPDLLRHNNYIFATVKIYWRVIRLIKPYKIYVALNALFNILSVIFSLFSLTMIAPFLDLLFLKDASYYNLTLSKGQPDFDFKAQSLIENFYFYLTRIITDPARGKETALLYICILVVILFFLKNFFRYLGMYFMSNIRNYVVRDMRNRVHKKIMQLPLSYYSEEKKGDILSRTTTDIAEVEWSVMSSLEVAFRDPVNIILFLGMMIFISLKLTLFVFLILPVTGLLLALIGKSLRRTSMKAKYFLGQLFSLIEETISGLRIIKGFNADNFVAEKFKKVNNDFTRVSIRVYRKTDLSAPLSEFLGTAALMIVIYFGGNLVLNNDETLSASAFITFIAVFSQLIPPAKSFTTAFYNIQKGIASAERIFAILDAPETISDPEKPVALSSFKNKIEYRNVSFAYQRGDAGYVLKNINLVIEKGKTIALVGQSGSGKTTLSDMLPRYYDPGSGEILIDGVNIRHAAVKDVRALMGIVSQEPILFNDSVFNNIAFGFENALEEDVIAAAKIANAHEFISQMPEAYESNIGDRGNKLSGGQRQRLSIARAVLKNPPVLILDEATSALDTESERLVQEALTKLMQNRTTLVIAHRLSTIQHADEIIVLNKGEIVQRGTHSLLSVQDGIYKKLYELQGFN